MPQLRQTAAIDLAHDVAPGLDAILFTHYPDADTLDLIRPGQTDLAAIQATIRAVAAVLLEAGVEILVQRADRAAFRRWMAGRDDTPDTRSAWIDRTRLLRGPAALALLGLPPAPAAPPRHRFGPAPGPVAARLLDAYADDDSDEFDILVQALLAAGRTDVLDLAVRKHGEQHGDEAGDELNWVLLVAAEGAAIGPSGWAELVALPVAMGAGDVPDGEALGASLIASGALAATEEIRFLPGWRSPDAITGLSFAAVRRILLDMADGKPPQDLPPGDTDDLARQGFGVLLALRIDWAIPVWEAIEAAGGLPEPADDATEPGPEETARAACFDTWRTRVFEQTQGCVPLDIVALSQTANEIADFLAEAGQQTGAIEDIRAFVAEGRSKAGGADIVCHPTIIGDDLELSLYTAGGDLLDRMTLPASRLPAGAAQMPPLIAALMRPGN